MSHLQLVPELEPFELTAAQLTAVHVGRTVSFWDPRQGYRVLGKITGPPYLNDPADLPSVPRGARKLMVLPIGRGKPLLVPSMTPVVVLPANRRIMITTTPKEQD